MLHQHPTVISAKNTIATLQDEVVNVVIPLAYESIATTRPFENLLGTIFGIYQPVNELEYE